MKRLLLKIIRVSVRLIARAHPSLPQSLERELKQMQGKGDGGLSVDLEAKTSINFLNKFKISSPIILDVGANVGLYTEQILKLVPNARIYAFEPSNMAIVQLKNKFHDDPRVNIISKALGDDESYSNLWSDLPGSGLASLTKRRLDHFNIQFEESQVVHVVTLDSVMKDLNLEPDLLKMDVEGHEFSILMGATKTINSLSVIQFEFGGCNIDTRTFFQDFWYFFEKSNFSLFRISKNGPIPIYYYSEDDEYFSTTNFVAVRNQSN